MEPPRTVFEISDENGDTVKLHLGAITPDGHYQYGWVLGAPKYYWLHREWTQKVELLVTDPPYATEARRAAVPIPRPVHAPTLAPWNQPSGYCNDETEAFKHLRQDCAVLLELKSALAGGVDLNWNWDMPISNWHGVQLEGSPFRVTALHLQSAGLAGSIPPSLSSLAELRWLDLDGNRLTGPIPPELGKLASLEHLVLSNNQLSGRIPGELGQLTRLTWLGLSNNQLNGELPPRLAQLTNLRILELSDNQLDGCMPSAWRTVGDLSAPLYFCDSPENLPRAAPTPVRPLSTPTPAPPGPVSTPSPDVAVQVLALRTIGEGHEEVWNFSYARPAGVDRPDRWVDGILGAHLSGRVYLPENSWVMLVLTADDGERHTIEAPGLFNQYWWPSDMVGSIKFHTGEAREVLGQDEAGNPVRFIVVPPSELEEIVSALVILN